MYCLGCGRHTRWLKTDKWEKNEEGEKIRKWKCGTCGRVQAGYPPVKRQKPRELYFDIETSPNLAFLWSLKVNGYVNPEMVVHDWFVISWAAMWVGEDDVYSGVVSPAAARRWDDKKIIKPLWELMNQADVVIGHNAKNFDIKSINTRFIIHGLLPPEDYKTIDTLTLARSKFRFQSNKMDFISARLNGINKHDMGFQDWRDCIAGKKDALDKMVSYNINDVREGALLYQKMIDWMPVQHGQTVKREVVR